MCPPRRARPRPPPPPPSQPAHAPRRQLYTPSPSPGRIIPTGANPPNRPPIQYGRRWGAGAIPSISAPAHIILHDASPRPRRSPRLLSAARSPLPVPSTHHRPTPRPRTWAGPGPTRARTRAAPPNPSAIYVRGNVWVCCHYSRARVPRTEIRTQQLAGLLCPERSISSRARISRA